MESIVQLCLGVICVLTPVLLVALSGGAYALGIGVIKVPGIGRREKVAGKDWTTVPDLTRKATETLAAVVSLVGTLFGLVGFLLPWVSVNLGGSSQLFNLGGLEGTLSGIALAFQSLLAGIGFFSAKFEGASTIGFVLIAISLLVSLIPLALLASAAIGVGLISVPLGLVNVKIQRLAGMLVTMSALSLCLTCAFFAGIQATVGGIKVGGSEGVFGTSVSMGVEVTNGFWITVGGLVLALIGAIVANTLAATLENWVKNLSSLDKDAGKVEDTPAS